MIRAMQFTIAKLWKWLRSQTIMNENKKVWYVYIYRYRYSEILYNHKKKIVKEERNQVICMKTDGTRENHVN